MVRICWSCPDFECSSRTSEIIYTGPIDLTRFVSFSVCVSFGGIFGASGRRVVIIEMLQTRVGDRFSKETFCALPCC